MATAIEPGSQPQTPATPLGLPIASLLGAIYVFATIAVVFYAVPAVLTGAITTNRLAAFAIESAIQVAVFVGLVWFGRSLLGPNPVKGIRGGIFLILVSVGLIFFVWIAGGLIVGSVLALLLAFGAVKLITGKTGEGWMVALEEQGWFSTALYKKTLGIRVRRLTILGLLLLGGTGVYTLWAQGTLPQNWVVTLPFETPTTFTVLPDAQYSGLLILAALTLWVAWRATNVPTFSEFLIATEAEMNKVSWSPKKRLAQDTVVVLTTTLLMALFLLVVDLFWGWLLSRNIVGVLPSKATGQDKAGKIERARW
jgi:preprotein translocase SecE subunit